MFIDDVYEGEKTIEEVDQYFGLLGKFNIGVEEMTEYFDKIGRYYKEKPLNKPLELLYELSFVKYQEITGITVDKIVITQKEIVEAKKVKEKLAPVYETHSKFCLFFEVFKKACICESLGYDMGLDAL